MAVNLNDLIFTFCGPFAPRPGVERKQAAGTGSNVLSERMDPIA